MRLKTEERRRAIMDAAKALFLAHGYAATSMSEVSARSGGSKQTLYNYFKSKESLFVAVMMERGAKRVSLLFSRLGEHEDLRADLTAFGVAFLTFVMDEEISAFRRVILAEGARFDLGRLYFESGPKQDWLRVASYFELLMHKGVMRQADPWTAAMHLEGLLEAGPFQRYLEGSCDRASSDEVEETVQAAIDVFQRAYAVETD
ncbi:MAG: TetR/AcrR family transcriptional regulator [bacterium]|nr:TetR/AcrR family transcriptional regulator [bacterium]